MSSTRLVLHSQRMLWRYPVRGMIAASGSLLGIGVLTLVLSLGGAALAQVTRTINQLFGGASIGVMAGGTRFLGGPRPDSGHGLIVEYPEAKIVRLTEEHAEVDVSTCARRPRIGERVSVVPNHICPCVNLLHSFWWWENNSPVGIRVDARGHVARHHDHFGFHVAAPRRIAQRDRVAGRQKRIAAALVHQRIVPEAVRHFGPARLPHERDMVYIGAAVRPLIGARQRRGGVAFVESFLRDRIVIEVFGKRGKPRRGIGPIVERRLHRRHDCRGVGIPGEIIGDDDEPSVAAGFE